MSDGEWIERQRRFQARILSDPDPPIGPMLFRTTVGSAQAEPAPPLGRFGRAAIVLVGVASVVGLLLLLDVSRVVPALVAGLGGGLALVLGLSGPPAQPRNDLDVALLALWPRDARAGDPPSCVAPILAADRRRLGVDGEVTVVGRARPDATFGAFAVDHLVWPQARPRRARVDDPRLGD